LPVDGRRLPPLPLPRSSIGAGSSGRARR
jgi:hypothetical protein